MKGTLTVHTKRWLVAAGAAVLICLPVTAEAAVTPTATDTGGQLAVIPAPAGSAEAYAAQVDGLLTISHTKASASGTGTSSTANALELGGAPPAAQFGGSQSGAGTSSGNFLDTGPSNTVRIQVTPWSATNSQSAGLATGSAFAALLGVTVGDTSTPQSASVWVLPSQSNATWSPASSSGNSSSDGLIVDAGGPNGLSLDVLHAETTSGGTGNSYILSLNGNKVGSSEQANGQCAINVPSLLALNCLTASGGTSGQVTSAGASVLSGVLGGSNGLPVGLITAGSQFGAAPASPAAGTGTGAQESGPAAASATPAAASPASGNLAFTGLDVAALVALALLLTVGGATLVCWTRRPATLTP